MPLISNVLGLVLLIALLSPAHAEIVTRFGSVEGFLRDGLGWSDPGLERLRDELLEEAPPHAS